MKTTLRVTMPDSSKWDVPVRVIADHRAKYYFDRKRDDGTREFSSFEQSLNEDTIPLFESDPYEIEDWAANNMNWQDVVKHAKQFCKPKVSYQDGWVNGEKELL